MSTVKSSPFSSRTKSLRERFGSKRSYSESFKDPPVTASEPTATMGSPDLSSHRQTFPSIPAQRIAASTGQLRYSPLQSDEFNPYAALPEETYCSALDINSQEGDPRFPWQRDAAIQCDMSSEEASSYTTAGSIRGHSPDYRSSTVEGLLSAPQGSRTQSPTHGGTARTRWGTEALTSSPQKESPKRRSMLQRAMSLERGRSKGGLKHQASLDETRETRTASGNKQMYVPHHVQTLTPSLESQASIESSSPTSKDSLHSFNSYGGPVTSGHTSSNTSVYSVTSSGSTTPSVTPPQSPPTSSACSRKPSLSERKKLGFLRKQTNSAPESFEDTTTPTPERPTPQASNYFNFECMQRLLEMSIKATGSQTGALAENRNFLLNIPTNARDGKSPAGYLSLPSPNLQGEENESSNVFKRLSSAGANTDQENESEQDEVQEEPPASALHRRRALVPPKMLTDGYESASEETDRSSMCHSQSHLNLPGDSKNRRRSSIVVIPPMQICPGDLLVYGKVLGNRNNLLDATRKGKNTWSLLRLFDRSSRAKSDSLGGLEEVLSNIQPSEFIDGQLAKYKGMMWTDFVSHVEERVKKQSLTAHVQRNVPSRSPSETHSWATCPDADPPPTPPSFEMEEAIIYTPGPSSSSTSLPPPPQITVADVSATLSRSDDYGSNIRGDYANSSSSSQTKSGSCDSVPMAGHTGMVWARAEQKRQELMWDLFQSKCMFLYDHLMVLKNVFMEPLKKIQVEGFAMFAEPEVLFGNLDELCLVTYAFCKEFLILITQSIRNGDIDATEILVKLFLKSSKATALTQAYHRYTLNYINALNYLETLRRQSEFNEFEKWCSRDPRCKKLQLTDLLVSPVQHIMRIPLIVKEIEMRTENMTDRQTINTILEGEEHSLRELDDKMKWLKNFERLLEVQRNIVWPSITELDPKAFIPEFLKAPLSKQPCERLIVSPRRQIILEGPLQLLDSGKATEMYVLLFDDMLLITRRKKGLHKKKSSITENWASSCGRGGSVHEGMFKYVVYKQPLSLDRFIIHDVNPQDGAANNLKNAFVLVCLNRFQQIYTVHSFQAPSENVKTTWLFKLRDTIDRWKRTLQNTVFRTNRMSNSGSTTVK